MGLFANISKLDELDIAERRVFLRADLDVALSSFGGLLDDAPLRAALPTLRRLLAQRCRIVVGASCGSAPAPAPSNAMAVIAQRLTELLGSHVGVLGPYFPREIQLLEPGQIALTPNLLDVPEELSNDLEMARSIARAIDVYVCDGLRAARSEWASTSTLPRLVPARAAGPQLWAGLSMLELLSGKPAHPFAAVVGGDSFARKSRLLWALLLHAKAVLLGGVVANTCLVAGGWRPGASRYEPSELGAARAFLDAARAHGVAVHLPEDAVTMLWQAGLASTERRAIAAVPDNEAVVDIGLETALQYRDVIRGFPTVLWTGLLGMAEVDELSGGTYRVAQAASLAEQSCVFGRRTLAAAERLDVLTPFTLVSRGGDAMLSLLGGSVLPGIESLRSPGR
jgi:phosphoglycerate kinase